MGVGTFSLVVVSGLLEAMSRCRKGLADTKIDGIVKIYWKTGRDRRAETKKLLEEQLDGLRDGYKSKLHLAVGRLEAGNLPVAVFSAHRNCKLCFEPTRVFVYDSHGIFVCLHCSGNEMCA